MLRFPASRGGTFPSPVEMEFMKMSRRRLALIRLAVFLTAGALWALPAPARDKSSASSPTWRAVYVSGSRSVKEGKKLTLEAGADGITAKTRKELAFTIPAGGIVEVALDTFPHRPVIGWLVDSPQIQPGFQGEGVDLESVSESTPQVVVMNANAPPPSDGAESWEVRYFVRIVWQEKGAMENVILKMEEEDYPLFLEEIKNLMGIPWKDLPQERALRIKELERRKEDALPLELDREARVADTKLPAGSYQILLIPKEPQRGDLYFFAGKSVAPKKIAAHAVVAIEATDSGPAKAEPGYFEQEGVDALSVVRLSGENLRLPSSHRPALAQRPPVSFDAPPARRFEADSGFVAFVTFVIHDGEAALRFPVMHSGSRPCEGFLYVTARGIDYDPVFDPRPKEAFSATRDQISDVTVSEDSGSCSFEIADPVGDQSFRPLYEQGNFRRPSLGFTSTDKKADQEFVSYLVRVYRDFPAAEQELMKGKTAKP
jgi:hypothetical protein